MVKKKKNFIKLPEKIKLNFSLIYIITVFLETSIHPKIIQTTLHDRVWFQVPIISTFRSGRIFERFVEWGTIFYSAILCIGECLVAPNSVHSIKHLPKYRQPEIFLSCVCDSLRPVHTIETHYIS